MLRLMLLILLRVLFAGKSSLVVAAVLGSSSLVVAAVLGKSDRICLSALV